MGKVVVWMLEASEERTLGYVEELAHARNFYDLFRLLEGPSRERGEEGWERRRWEGKRTGIAGS